MTYNMNSLADVVSKRSKNYNVGSIIQFICFFLLPTIPVALASYLTNGVLIGGTKTIITLSCGALMVLMFFIYGKIIFFMEEKNLKDLLETEKKIGIVAMYSPYMHIEKGNAFLQILSDSSEKIKTNEDKYYLYFHPYTKDSSMRVKFEITKEQYEKYKEKVENYDFSLYSERLVLIESNTGLFDGKMEYTTSSNDFNF